MIILKLGGSILTRKEEATPSLVEKNLERVAREISQSHYEKLVIVHGAGSYGHPLAQKYAIGNKIMDEKEFEYKRMGFSLIHHSVQQLNQAVVEHLLNFNIPAIPLAPSTFILTQDKRIHHAPLEMIRRYLNLGFVPVLFGDVVLEVDGESRMTVLSGDQIIKLLAETLKPQRVILGTDVDGVYDRNPKKDPKAQLLSQVTSLEDVELVQGADTIDVTGGMRGKLNELLELASKGVESQIINANKDNNIRKAINGQIMGTIIKKN